MTGFFILIAAGSFLLSMALTAVMRRIAPALGLVDHPGDRKIHRTPTPSGGGAAIFVASWLPVAVSLVVCFLLRSGRLSPSFWPELASHATGVATQARPLAVVFVGASVIWLVGLADDRWGLSPWLRFAFHIAMGFLFVLNGMTVTVFMDSPVLGALATILWIVALINAFNFLDNMDGLCAGVALIISVVFVVVAVQTGQHFISAFLCCLAGALGGFLLFNFPPASIFMGDSGSTLVGFLLAAMTVQFTFFESELPGSVPQHSYFPIVVPLLIFALPLFDAITVVWIRVRNGRSPFRGDTNHFSHRLVALGMSRRQAVLFIYLITATIALGATVLYYANAGAILVIFAQAVAVFTIIGILENARPRKSENREAPR